MDRKKRFLGLFVVLAIFGAFNIYRAVDNNNRMEDIKKENKEILNEIKVLEIDNKKMKEELKKRDSDIDKTNKELEDTKRELELKKTEIDKMKEENQLLVSQEDNNIIEGPKYKNLEQEVNAKYHERIGRGMSHAEAYEYANGVPYTDEQTLRGYVNSTNDEGISESIKQRDEFAASFEAEYGRQPTSGEIQSQWLKEQGFE